MKVGYARLSTGDPDGLTLQIQHDRLQAAGCHRIFSEVISGNARHRPQWEALKEAIGEGQVSEVVALRMDRLSRSWTAIGEVIDLFSQPGAPRLTLLDEPQMDLNTIGGRTVAGVLASVAAGERERIVSRSTAGLRKRHAAGKRHKVPFGLTSDEEGYPVIDRRPWLCTLSDQRTWSRGEVAAVLWDHWESAPTRYSAKRLAAERFGLISFQGGSAAVWACNPMLRGALTGGTRDRYGGYPSVQEDAFEPLISKERHLAAVATFLRERSSNNSYRTAKVTPLSGKVLCGDCGYRMTFHRSLQHPTHPWTFRCRRYGCRYAYSRVMFNDVAEACRQHLISRQDRLLQALSAAMTPATVDPDLERRIRDAQQQVEDLRAIVARRPTPRLQQELQQAETELADLHLALNAPPQQTVDPLQAMRALAPLFSGQLRAQQAADGSIDLHVPVPEEDASAADLVSNLLTPEAFRQNLNLLVLLAIHSVVVDPLTPTFTVRDNLDSGLDFVNLRHASFAVDVTVEAT